MFWQVLRMTYFSAALFFNKQITQVYQSHYLFCYIDSHFLETILSDHQQKYQMKDHYSNQTFRPFHKPSLPRYSSRHYPQFNSFKLQFGYSNPKQKNQPLSPLAHQQQHSLQKMSMTHYNPEVFQRHSSTFYGSKKSSPKVKRDSNKSTQLPEMQYVKRGFPQRKKKTGEQQYLKLLIKLADLTDQSNRRHLALHEPLFDQNQHKKNIGPRLKMRNTLKWTKERYCINRDKQMGMFSSSFGSEKMRETHF